MANPESLKQVLTPEKAEELSGVVGDELRQRPDLVTNGNKIAHIWAIFHEQIKDEYTLARLLGVGETREEMYDMMRGVIATNLKDRLDKTTAYAIMLEREVPDTKELSRILVTPIRWLSIDPSDPKLPARSPMECMKRGDIDIVLLRAGVDFKDKHIWE